MVLYIKKHNKTGLKYFGFTRQNPYVYMGSGKLWLRHIKKYGYDVTTEIYSFCENMKEVKVWGKYFSKINNIVESKNWANLTSEEGQGGCNHNKHTSQKISENHAPCAGKDNSNFVGWYVTPWGIFDSRSKASNAINNAISSQSLLKYCRYNNKETVKKETLKARGKKHRYFTITDVGKTFEHLGFGFIPKSQDDSKLD